MTKVSVEATGDVAELVISAPPLTPAPPVSLLNSM